MKEELKMTLCGIAFVIFCGLLFLYMPYIAFFIFHSWDDASKWDCTYNGGVWTATTTWGYTHLCTQPLQA